MNEGDVWFVKLALMETTKTHVQLFIRHKHIIFFKNIKTQALITKLANYYNMCASLFTQVLTRALNTWNKLKDINNISVEYLYLWKYPLHAFNCSN